METYFLKDDIRLVCVNATSYPQGIADAFERLQKNFRGPKDRKLYGISFGSENGKIFYKAAAEELDRNDENESRLEKFVVKKGEYIGTRIINYPDHLDSIGKTFEKLLANPRLDPNGCCVEIYLNEKDVQCMVRLESKSSNKH